MEQRTYGRWLDWGTRLGLSATIGAFFLYAFGVVEPFVPPGRLAELWAMPVERYLAAIGAGAGWSWLGLVGMSDYLNLLTVALLALVTIVCYVRIAALYWRRGEPLQAGMAMAQVLVLLAAASGLLAGSH